MQKIFKIQRSGDSAVTSYQYEIPKKNNYLCVILKLFEYIDIIYIESQL